MNTLELEQQNNLTTLEHSNTPRTQKKPESNTRKSVQNTLDTLGHTHEHIELSLATDPSVASPRSGLTDRSVAAITSVSRGWQFVTIVVTTHHHVGKVRP